MRDNGICALRRLAWVPEKETRLKRQLLQHRVPPQKKLDISTTDAICMGDSRWNGVSELSEGELPSKPVIYRRKTLNVAKGLMPALALVKNQSDSLF